MKLDFFSYPIPFLIARDYYKDEERFMFMDELKKMKPLLLDGELTGSAINKYGEKKRNKGVFLYGQECPNNVIMKLLHDNLEEIKTRIPEKESFIYKYMGQHNPSSTLVNHYDNGDQYDTHCDDAILTSIYYIWDEPKPFDGGDLYFGEYKVPITNNSLLIFPSCTPHRVTKINGSGRWAISQFIMKRLGNVFKTNIYNYPKILSQQDFDYVHNFLENGNWKFTGKSGGNGSSKFWYMDLSNEHIFNTILLKRIEKITGRNFKLDRVYANGHTYGLDGEWHIDDPGNNSWTFLLYVNKNIDIKTWGGETEFCVDDGVYNVHPVTNTAVLFKSNILHRGKAPSRSSHDLRITVAWKLKEIT